MIQTLSVWLHGTKLSWAVAGGLPWLWPLCEALPFIGLALLVGIVGVLDLRMLGMEKGLPIGPLQRLMPFAILGFTINLVTGFLFFTGDPFQYIHNVAFGFKLLFIGLAGVNVILFYVTGLYRRGVPLRQGPLLPFQRQPDVAIHHFAGSAVRGHGAIQRHRRATRV